MEQCFVMQPFDGGTFDKRYESVFCPAISDAALEPYRVDRDPSVSIPIQDIEHGIRNAAICFADITLDNPNVWFELGFAMAIPREVVLVCSDERKTKYPFDVQHRSIIHYSTSAPQDFDEFRAKISERIRAILEKNERIGRVVSSSAVKDTEGLSQHEIVALVTIMQNSFLSDGYSSAYEIKKDMNNAGFTDIAVSIALKTLAMKKLILSDRIEDRDGELYTVYRATSDGEGWLIANQDKLRLKEEPEPRFKIDDDIPF